MAARVIQDKDYGEELNNGIKERVNITVLKLSRYDVLPFLKGLHYEIDFENVTRYLLLARSEYALLYC